MSVTPPRECGCVAGLGGQGGCSLGTKCRLTQPAQVRLSLLGTGSLPSCPVKLGPSQPALSLKLPNTAAPARVIRVRTVTAPLPLSAPHLPASFLPAAATITIIDAAPPGSSPVLIENLTCHELHVRQGGASSTSVPASLAIEALPPYGRLEYVWDDHASAGVLVLRLSCGIALHVDTASGAEKSQRARPSVLLAHLLSKGRARVVVDDAAMAHSTRKLAETLALSVRLSLIHI